MLSRNIEWQKNSEFPDELHPAQNNFSVDVLVYFECLDEHTIGWFDFKGMQWLFLSNQDYSGRKFQWRYFIDEIDKIKFKKNGKTKN